MGIHSTKGYGHRIRQIGPDHWRMSWTWDAHYRGSRLRYPRGMTRDTDDAGALRFVKKWRLQMPEALEQRKRSKMKEKT